MDRIRSAGILLHLTSLPGAGLGSSAYHFADILKACEQRVWQILPTGPTFSDHSPYASSSTHAGNPDLIDLFPLTEAGYLPQNHSYTHQDALKVAAKSFFSSHRSTESFEKFVTANRYWLHDYCMFISLKEHFNQQPWYTWPESFKHHELIDNKSILFLTERIKEIQFEQYIFNQQWQQLKAYVNASNISLFGDIPFYIAHDSVDCWAHPELFKTNEKGNLTVVAGVPPDYFSKTGQRWGNPCYAWDAHQKENFQWWKTRLTHHLSKVDLLRIDHFRGLRACWEIPSTFKTAKKGNWVEAPGEDLLNAVASCCDLNSIIAEDLGLITADVLKLRDDYNLPGMKVLQFGFDGNPDNPHSISNIETKDILYLGTHDNDTTVGWLNNLDEKTLSHVSDSQKNNKEKCLLLIQDAMNTDASLCIIAAQDWLTLDSKHRMNTPGTTQGNWQWKTNWAQWTDTIQNKIRSTTKLSMR